MDEGRLKAVKKGQKLHRKFAYAMNDTIRTRQQYYQNCLSREEQEAQARLMTKVINIRKTVVRNRVLLQCLNLHRNNQPDRARTEPSLGSYGGRPIDSFTRDIDQRLAWFHPKLRRLRKVDRVKQSCIKQGEILDEETIKDRMEDFFLKNQDLYPTGATVKPIKHNNKSGDSQRFHSIDEKAVVVDDDDFDLRDYHNPIAGANFKLRLHPFGNLVEFHNKGETKKFNLLTRRNVFVKNSVPSDPRERNGVLVDQNVTLSADERDIPTRIKSEPPFQNAKGAHSSSSSTQSPPLCFSKYSDPLPPITSSPDQKKRKSKEHSVNNSEHSHVKHQDKTESTEIDVSLEHLQGQKKDGDKSNRDGGSVVESKNSEQVKSKSTSLDDEGFPKLTRRKTLILPPLETSKEMMKKIE